ncbi:MAG: hypothetical protein QXD95_02775 [Nitrososphaeria archaeon]
MNKKRILVGKKEAEGKIFYFADIGSEDHGRKSFRLWVSSSLVEREEKDGMEIEFITLPREGVEVKKTEKGTLVLKKGPYNMFDVYVPCGYRGGSNFEFLSPVELVLPYEVYRSERGSLGVSRGALVLTRESFIKYKWKRTGRLYGEPGKGISIVYVDGKKEELSDIEDIEELKEVLEENS